MPGGKQHVIERFGVKVCFRSIPHKRFCCVLNADAQIVATGSASAAVLAPAWLNESDQKSSCSRCSASLR